MEAKEINLSASYIYGFFAAMISTLLYSAVLIPLYILIISLNSQNFLVYLLHTLDVWVWIWISISIIYAFIIIFMYPPNSQTNALRKKIATVLFFIVTLSIIILTLSYIPAIQQLLYREEYLFYNIILSVIIFFIALQLSINIKNITIFMYKLILFNLGYNINFENEDEYDSEYEIVKINTSDYEVFSNTLKNTIAFSQRHKYAIGVMAFKISNHKRLLEECGNLGYRVIQEELVKFIKQNARTGENDCLIDKNTIYTIIYATEDEAWKTTRRYFKALKNYLFQYNNENVNIEVSIAVSGFDFSNNKVNKMSSSVIKDIILEKIKDALIEAEETESPVIFYQKGI